MNYELKKNRNFADNYETKIHFVTDNDAVDDTQH